jgi:co-chaperonin GroES (HSP10)
MSKIIALKRNRRPLKEGVLVRLIPSEKVSAGGIIYSTGSQAVREDAATVEAYIVRKGIDALSQERWGDENPPKLKDRVLIKKYAGSETVELDDEGGLYKSIHDSDISDIFDGESFDGEFAFPGETL